MTYTFILKCALKLVEEIILFFFILEKSVQYIDVEEGRGCKLIGTLCIFKTDTYNYYNQNITINFDRSGLNYLTTPI